MFLDKKTDSLRHKDKKDIFSAGVFLDKKTNDLRHKDKKDIFPIWFSEDIKTKRTYFVFCAFIFGPCCFRASIFVYLRLVFLFFPLL